MNFRKINVIDFESLDPLYNTRLLRVVLRNEVSSLFILLQSNLWNSYCWKSYIFATFYRVAFFLWVANFMAFPSCRFSLCYAVWNFI